MLGRGVLGGRLIAEDGPELHDDIKELQPVHVRQPLQVLVHAYIIQFGHQLCQPLLSALQKPARRRYV